jgi:hypothetical protein
MPESFIGLVPDGTGKRIRTRTRQVAGEDRHEQYVTLAAAETWFAYADAVAFAQNKQHITLFNATGSGKLVKARKLFAYNLQTAAVTGVSCRFDLKRVTAGSAGTAITSAPADSLNAALPAGVAARTNATVTEGAILFPWLTSTDEELATPALSKGAFQQSTNILIEGNEVQELALREGEGLTVKQITNTTVGSYGWLIVFTVE